MANTVLNVEGMACPSCIKHIERALAMRGVTSVDVDLEQGTVTIEHEPALATRRLIAAIGDAGYEAQPRVTLEGSRA